MDKKLDHQVEPIQHWKSLEEWEQTPEFKATVENEFLSSPLSSEDKESPVARRDFLKLMGASLALSSAGCIRRPVQKIVPYVQRPKDVVLGVANYYTSTLLDGAEGFGIVVKTREGRPIKLEGNAKFPSNEKGLSVRGQAYVLSLYDPDRLRDPKRNLHNEKRTNKDTISVSWDEAQKSILKSLKKKGVAVLTPTLASPSSDKLISEFAKTFSGKHYQWDALVEDDLLEAQKASYGKSELPTYDFSKAKTIVSLGADFLGTYLSSEKYSRQWAKNRNPDKEMNRVVIFESNMSLTGANADERFIVKPSQYLDVAKNLIHEVGVLLGNAKAKAFSVTSIPGVDADRVKQAARDLVKHKGQGLVIAGGISARTETAVELQIAVNYLNSLLGNDGETVKHQTPRLTHQGSSANLSQLVKDIESGKVKSLIVYKSNPVYFLGKNSALVKAFNKLDAFVYAGDMNETGDYADYVLPVHHDMEEWGDSEFIQGVHAIRQPTIRPLHKTKGFEELLMGWMSSQGASLPDTWYDYLRNHWKNNVIGSVRFEGQWDKTLQEGVYEKSSSARRKPSFNDSALKRLSVKSKSSDKEIVLYKKVAIGDGEYANLSWLHELPDPVTKITWDNYISVSPNTAHKMHLKEGDVLKLTVGGKVIELPAHIQPGAHDDVFAVAVGYGRWQGGKVANGLGVNALALADFSGESPVYSGSSAKVEKTSKKIELACTQGHHSLEGRPLIADTTYGEYKKNPKSGQHKAHFEGTIWEDHKYTGHKWGMVIDTNTCTGCSACVVACQAENNIPVVGKKYILQGREMHWLRIDRYYSGQPSAPETVHQIMLCQHCDNAPCETVCPVVATSHSDEGLNEMTYNRCVGTRYCANNCPYKVRRFNWFSYLERRAPLEMALNPEVGVRSRGVMEKCSFCVHKIKEAKQVAKDEKRSLKDGDVQVACQSSCGTDSIIFGDLNDPESAVSKWAKKKRAYTVLEDLNVKPAVRYLTKVRNRDKIKTEHGEGHH